MKKLAYNNQLYKTLKLVENDKKYIIHFKYSYINESIFLLNKDNEIIFVICIDDFNIDFDEKGEILNPLIILEPNSKKIYETGKKYNLYTLKNSLPKSKEFSIYELNTENLKKLISKCLC